MEQACVRRSKTCFIVDAEPCARALISDIAQSAGAARLEFKSGLWSWSQVFSMSVRWKTFEARPN
jgi:hypothetical protein